MRDAHFLFRRDLALYRVAAGGEDAGGGRDLDGDRDGLLAYRQADALAVDLRDYAVSSFGPYNSTPLTRLDRISIS